MKNKFLINVYVVKLDKNYDIYIPSDLPVGEIANLICKAANILSENQLDSLIIIMLSWMVVMVNSMI